MWGGAADVHRHPRLRDDQLQRRRTHHRPRHQRLRGGQARPGRADARRGSECAARGIRVNTIHPAPTDTPFMRRIETAATGQPSEHAARAFDAMIPRGRHAAPEEIARTVLHLAGDDASFTTGATVAVDGGMSV
ncbi:SDR family oxidoreductase [Streptomyces sp. PA03-5A]|nr:SDR family oxidoreductase [Streptomyces sp. PA03-5A]